MTQIILELDGQLADKLRQFLQIAGNQGAVFSAFIDYQRGKAQREVERMQQDLSQYEQRYGMPSEAFYAKFNDGMLDDSNDFILWAGIYEMQLLSKKKLDALQ